MTPPSNNPAQRDLRSLEPEDVHNRRLRGAVRPADWKNPVPPGRYNLVVVGAGTAGLVMAAGAAGLGGKVALVEQRYLGGDCLNFGCVPSKALLRSARGVASVREAAEFGIRIPPGVEVDFAAVMERLRRLRADLSPHDSAARFQNMGVDVYFGSGKFVGTDRLEVGGQELQFARAAIATGTQPSVPAVPGLREAGYRTNETIFSLTELPRRLAVIGGGAIGCELAQAFARFGSEVVVFETHHGVLPHEDAEAAELVRQALLKDGVQLRCCGQNLEVQRVGSDKRLTVDSHGQRYEVSVDEILVATGRTPNLDSLGLEAAGVDFDAGGVIVDDFLRTTNSRIYAAGDICSRYKFTHAADALARIVIQNALFFGRRRAGSLIIPWCTYTDPELAHVGLYPHEAEARGVAVDTITVELADVDRAVLDGTASDGRRGGFLKIHHPRGKDQILGATLVAPHAGEMISEITLAMAAGRGLRTLANTVHPYPTQAEAFKKAGDAYNRTRLTPRVQRLFEALLRCRR